MKRMANLVIALTFGALAFVACGEDDQDEVRSVVKLLIDSDPARCDSMTRSFVEQNSGGVKQCRRISRENDPYPGAKIEDVAVDGDKATANVAYQGSRTQFKFVKQDDDWKINGVKGLPVDQTTADQDPKPKIRKGLDARETVDAYYQAIEDEDGAALCGLVSRRLATEMRGGKKTQNPIAACVQGLQAFDWSEPRKAAKGLKSVDATHSGGTATVILSNGKQALLKRFSGRWVVDSIKREG